MSGYAWTAAGRSFPFRGRGFPPVGCVRRARRPSPAGLKSLHRRGSLWCRRAALRQPLHSRCPPRAGVNRAGTTGRGTASERARSPQEHAGVRDEQGGCGCDLRQGQQVSPRRGGDGKLASWRVSVARPARMPFIAGGTRGGELGCRQGEKAPSRSWRPFAVAARSGQMGEQRKTGH